MCQVYFPHATAVHHQITQAAKFINTFILFQITQGIGNFHILFQTLFIAFQASLLANIVIQFVATQAHDINNTYSLADLKYASISEPFL
jgi:hypothetical protein